MRFVTGELPICDFCAERPVFYQVSWPNARPTIPPMLLCFRCSCDEPLRPGAYLEKIRTRRTPEQVRADALKMATASLGRPGVSAADTRLLRVTDEALTPEDAQALSDAMTDDMGLPLVNVECTGRDRATLYGRYCEPCRTIAAMDTKPARIVLHSSGQRLWILLHELAHHVQWDEGGGFDHDDNFAQMLADVVDAYAGGGQ